MKVIVTFTLVGESKDDAIKFKPQMEAFQAHIQSIKEQGAFGDPETEVRYLLKPGTWDRG